MIRPTDAIDVDDTEGVVATDIIRMGGGLSPKSDKKTYSSRSRYRYAHSMPTAGLGCPWSMHMPVAAISSQS
jgi:hypothetical protein